MRTRLFSVVVTVTSSFFVVACSYDFDKFTPLEATGSSTSGSGGAAAGASGSSTSSGSPGGASGSSMSSGPGAGGAAGAASGGTAGSAGSEGTDGAVDSSAMKESGPDSDAGTSDVRADIAADAPASSDAADVNSGEPDAPPDTRVADAPVDTGSCISSAECSCESFNGHAYRFCTTLRSWVDSESQCAQSGMRLARVDDALENGFIRTTADAHAMAETWIGIQDPTTTLHWQWPDGTQFWSGDSSGMPVGGLYNNWSASKPTGTPVKNCGSMLGSASAGGWQDRSCTSLLPYVCELY